MLNPDKYLNYIRLKNLIDKNPNSDVLLNCYIDTGKAYEYIGCLSCNTSTLKIKDGMGRNIAVLSTYKYLYLHTIYCDIVEVKFL